MLKHVLVCLTLLVNLSLVYAQVEAYTPEKLLELKRISGTVGNSDGTWICYQATTSDYHTNGSSTETILQEVKTGLVTTIPLSGIWNIQWVSPNEFSFLQEQNGNILLAKYDIHTKNQTTLHHFGAASVDGMVMSADQTRFATLEPIKIDESLTDIYPDMNLSSARIEDDLMYRHWNKWTTPEKLHLFWYEKQADGTFKKIRDVMLTEPFASVQGPFGGIEGVTFSKDGQTIFYSTKKMAGKQFAISTNSEVYAFRTSDNITTTLTSAHKGYDSSPRINGTGKTLAWLSMDRDGFEADKNRIRVMDLATRKERDLTENLDLSVDEFCWNTQADIIYFIAAINGTKQVFQVDLKSGKIEQLTHERCDYHSVSYSNGSLFLERQDMIHPTDVYRFDLKTKKVIQLTQINKKELAGIPEPKVVEKWITTTDNKKMLTWVILPPDYDSTKQYPALLYCQGGPQSPVSQFFSYRWNFRMMASNGYIVIAPNRRGLPGFGQEWNDAISKDWGGQAMRDYLVAVDSCVAQMPSIDKNRLGAVGASYGGYSVYYLAGIHENRFKTFISHCGLFNLESWYGTTEELFFANWDIGGPYWLPENKAFYEKNSPHKLVDKWNTPMLVIHGGNDFRVPVSEGMQAFQVLQIKGIPSKFLYFPDEGHWVVKPQNSIVWTREFYKWLDLYLK